MALQFAAQLSLGMGLLHPRPRRSGWGEIFAAPANSRLSQSYDYNGARPPAFAIAPT
jgi:hypothetical protein